VHMKNGVFVRSEDRWTSECVRADEGLVDWRTLFAELQQRNYGGWIVIDRLSGEPLEERLEEDRATAEALWNDALSRPGGETIGSAAT
jgi:L-ribulose-5-phosphate 3-epimerase UlaE